MKDAFFNSDTMTVEGPPEEYVPDPRGLGHAFYNQMKRNRHAIAQIDIDSGLNETYGSLLKRSVRTSLELRRKGIKPGDIITLCSSNNIDNVVPFIAAQMVGAIMASLDPTMSILDTVHLIKQVEPKIIFVSTNAEQLIEDSLAQIEGVEVEVVTFGDNNKLTNFAEFLEPKIDENEFEPYEVDDLKQTAVILFSSGTTGLSKGICTTHYGLSYQANAFFTNGLNLDRMLSYATTYWVSTVVLICANQIFGKTRMIPSKFSPKEIWHIIDKYKVTFMFLAPTQGIHMLKSGRPEGVDTTSLQDINFGGGPLSVENNLAIRDLLPGTNIHLIYGQSEAAGLVTAFRPVDRRDIIAIHEKPASSGKPMMGYKYKIIDPETEEALGPNQQGELRYFCNAQMTGYYNRDSSDAFDADGWIRSGDITYFDDELCFYIVDRIKDMLKFQAYHIPPARIEGVLLEHPEVASAVVVGIPNEEDGDHPLGLVLVKPGSQVTEDELVMYVEKKLDDRHRLRAGVKFLESFPITPSGKVKKLLLRNMAIRGEI